MTVETNPANAYLRTKVLTASPEELRLLLLDGAIKFARQGREGLAARNYEASFNGISQCRNIVLELLTTIKPEFATRSLDGKSVMYRFGNDRVDPGDQSLFYMAKTNANRASGQHSTSRMHQTRNFPTP